MPKHREYMTAEIRVNDLDLAGFVALERAVLETEKETG